MSDFLSPPVLFLWCCQTDLKRDWSPYKCAVKKFFRNGNHTSLAGRWAIAVARSGYYTNRPDFGGCMGINPKAPAWTPGPSSSGDRRGDSLERIRRAILYTAWVVRTRAWVEDTTVGAVRPPATIDMLFVVRRLY